MPMGLRVDRRGRLAFREGQDLHQDPHSRHRGDLRSRLKGAVSRSNPSSRSFRLIRDRNKKLSARHRYYFFHQGQKTHRLRDGALNLADLTNYTLNDDPQPQVLFTFGFSNLKPAPSRVST